MTLLMTAKQPLQTISYVSKAVFRGQRNIGTKSSGRKVNDFILSELIIYLYRQILDTKTGFMSYEACLCV